MGKKILIIGKIPPPIGGVTIHVKRLLDKLSAVREPEIVFNNLSDGIWPLVKNTTKHRLIHLHTSNIVLRFVYSLFCLLLFKRLIITVHGNLGRFGGIKNLLDILSIKFSFIPIMLNQESYHAALRINKRAKLMTAFIPPEYCTPLSQEIYERISELKKTHKYVVSSNAFNLTWDKNGAEIYGIVQLIRVAREIDGLGLIISDPSAAYAAFLRNEKIQVPGNVLVISCEHDFYEVLKLSDAFIRNTSTDGDSLSIREAMFLGKTVFATDVIDRPESCILYSRNDDTEIIGLLGSFKPSNRKELMNSCFPELLDLYRSILN